jgi:hypothetical protein
MVSKRIGLTREREFIAISQKHNLRASDYNYSGLKLGLPHNLQIKFLGITKP